MTTSIIGVSEFVAMMKGVAAKIKSECAWLTELDSACGDGDHGTTMSRAMELLNKTLEESREHDVKGLMSSIGWMFLGIDGGATGPLLGTLFLGMSNAVREEEVLDAPRLVVVFEAGVESLRKRTQAQVGDKTVMDALVPAVEVMRKAAEGKQDVLEMLHQAAQAAQRGAALTKGLIARYGKARFSESRTLGHQDPGATSMAMFFQGFYEGLLTVQDR